MTDSALNAETTVDAVPATDLALHEDLKPDPYLTVGEEDAIPQAWKAGKREWLIIACLCIINACVALDATIVVPSLPTIAEEIGADAVQAFWIGTAYLIPTAVSQLFINGLSESFGRLPLLLFSIACFTIGSIVAALSHDIPQMLVGRVIQGVGGGGINCLTVVIITDIVPMRQRPNFFAYPQLTWALGTMTGPLIGGALSNHWRWVFWLNLFFCAPGIVMAPLVVKVARRTEKLPFLTALARVDWIGATLFIGGLTAFLVGLSWGGTNYPWQSYQTLLPLILGAVTTGVALLWEVRWAKYPFIELAIYKSYTCAALLLTIFLQGFMLYLSLYVWNLYFQGVKGKSPLGVGVAILPVMCSVMPASIVVGILIARFERYKLPLIVGWTLIVLSNGLVLLWNLTTPTATWAATQVVAGLGQGTVLISTFVALQSQVSDEHMTHAAAMYAFLRELGLSCGVGIGGTIFQNSLRRWLAEAHLPLDIALNIEAYVRQLNAMPSSQYITAVRVAIASAHKNVFEVCLAFAALALLLVIGVKQVPGSATQGPVGDAEGHGETMLLKDVAPDPNRKTLQDSAWTSARLSTDLATVV